MKRHLITSTLVIGLAFSAARCGNGGNFGSPDTGVDATGDSNIQFMVDGMSDSGSCTQCSADLREILSCGSNPQVLQQCTGTTGCGPQGCIDACLAAAANQSTIGCDYYTLPADAWMASPPSAYEGAAGNCFAAFVNNTWDTPLKVTLVWKGTTIDATPFSFLPMGTGSAITYQPIPSTGIPANSMAIVFLNQTFTNPGNSPIKVNCPTGIHAAIETEDMVIHATSISNAMEIQTSVPAIVYDIYPYGGALSYTPSATLLIPTTAWSTNYVAVTMSESTPFYPGIDLVAQQDGTQITMLPSTNITASMGVPAATKNVTTTYTIDKGQSVHIMQPVDGSGNDLSGSIVQSNYPVGVWGEHFCFFTDSPPPWRIMGMVDGTTLAYDPPNAGAPATLQRGQVIEFAGPNAFHVISQDNTHPFYLAAHRPGSDGDSGHQQIPPVQMLGSEYAAVTNEATDYALGGPETVNMIPPTQFLSSYLFFTDPTYANTEVALVRGKATDGTFKDVKLDCLGTVTGWMPIGTAGTYQYVHVDLRQNDTPVGMCDNGLHTITSDSPFGITVWGYASAASYAYPAGASVKAVNTVVVAPTPN